MKVIPAGGDTQAAGVLRTIDVGLSMRPEDQLMIMNVLSNTLYTDKISAVWREYGCNGMDANIEAGYGNRPIEISLPTATDPSAVIRDFGAGMTEEQVAETYCKMGCSTKRNSNAVTGMLGIGSKAGFAYGDAFTVTCFAGGIKTIYNCFRDKGVPRMAKLHSGPTDEHTGVEIKVPVRRLDIPEFISRAERVFRYFKVRPIIKNGSLQFQDRTATMEGGRWRFTGNERSVAIMGNVGYSINADAFPSDFPLKKSALLRAGIELDFDIGELEIAANREGLQYKDVTLHAISRLLGIAQQEISATFTDQIKNATSLWEATKIWANMFEKTGNEGMRLVRQSLDGQVTWKGIKLRSGTFDLDNKEDTPGVNITEYSKWGWRQRLTRRTDARDCPVRDTTVLVLNDNKSKKISPSKVKYWFQQHQTLTHMVIFTFEDDKVMDTYCTNRNLTGVTFLLMSTMPKPPPIVGQVSGASRYRAQHSARVLELDETKSQYSYPRSTFWKPALVDKDGDVTYVLISGYEPIETMSSTWRLIEIVKAARALGFITTPVYGVKVKTDDNGKTIPVTKLGSKWVTVTELLLSKLKARFAQRATLAQELADYIEADAYTPWLQPTFADKLFTGSYARHILSEFKRMKNGMGLKALFQLHKLAPSLIQQTLPVPTNKFEDMEVKLLTQYPMLKYSEYEARQETRIAKIQSVIDYVNLVEAFNAGLAGTTQKLANKQTV